MTQSLYVLTYPDATVMPNELIKATWNKALKDWNQNFCQFAPGVAGLKVLGNLYWNPVGGPPLSPEGGSHCVES